MNFNIGQTSDKLVTKLRVYNGIIGGRIELARLGSGPQAGGKRGEGLRRLQFPHAELMAFHAGVDCRAEIRFEAFTENSVLGVRPARSRKRQGLSRSGAPLIRREW